MLEAGGGEGGAEAFNGVVVVGLGFGADEANGAAHGSGADRMAELFFSVLAEIAEDAGN
jgi:hypothetical protein